MAGAAAIVVAGLAFVLFRRFGPSRRKTPAAYADAAIALGGRQDFLRMLASQLDAHVKSGRQLAVHVVDIDRFRAVNEVLGEAEGDAFLKLVSERLLVLVDRADRVARIGDDEFAVMQPEAGGARHAEIYSRRLQEALKDACAQVARHARPSASIGVAVSPDHGDDPAKLLHSASLALHAAKKVGGSTVRLYSREMDMALETRLQLEHAISEGLHQGWFDLHYQPQYDLGTRRLTGFEALVRMNHPKLGEVPPTVFIPVADASGLIQPLGEWIIQTALATAAEWPSDLTLSLNISLAQFRNGDVAGAILHALTSSGFQGSRLRIEVSEAVLLENTEAVNEQLKRLRSRGIAVVLDDFGLDMSRLKLLSRSPCDAVKLDRSLVERVGEVPEIEVLVRSLIGTAQSFDLDILAEGVERAEQAHFLMSNDCKKVQGFLFGRPAPAIELAAIIAKDARNAFGEPTAPQSSTVAA